MSTRRRTPFRSARGFTLVDVLLVIVLLGVMGGGLTLMSGQLAVQSAQALKTRQALALAQGLLDEVVQMPFPYCTGSDPRLATATGAFVGATGCTTVDAMGPEANETRYPASAGPPAVTRFDSITDYQGFTMPGPGCASLCDRERNAYGAAGSALNGCVVNVNLQAQAVASVPALDANGRPQSLRVAVTVTCPAMDPLVVEAIRIRDAPNQL